jgi:biopolymer transport protein ExbD
VRIEVLEERVRQLMVNRTDKQVFIRSEGQLQVQDLIDVLDTLKGAGVQTAGIVTDPPERR